MKTKSFAGVLCLLAALLASPAMAQTSCPGARTVNLAGVADAIARNGASTPVGGVLFEHRFVHHSTLLAICAPSPAREERVRYFPQVSSAHPYLGNFLYDSGVGGVAMSIDVSDFLNSGFPGAAVRLPTTTPVHGVWFFQSSPLNVWSLSYMMARIRFVKTGPITGGTLSGDPLVLRLANGVAPVTYRFSANQVVQPQIPTCRVTPNNNQPVRVGTVETSVFSGVGSASPAVTFPVRLDCAGGAAGSKVAVHAVLTDATNTANRSANLSLIPASTARGVALQVLKDGNVLSYGPDSSAAGTANQWPIATLGNETHTFNLAARYVQAATAITPGSANGVATITLSYQ